MVQVTYKDAGVDLELYDQAMAALPPLMRKTHGPRVIPNEGGFAGLFRLDYNSRLFAKNYREPVLVSCNDGVGTKVKVAILAGVYNTVGIDLVAMSVNDCLCTGAEPLFFLDYLGLGKDDPDLIVQLVSGVAQGCLESDIALLGGETAIMPDLYAPGDFDLGGFCVGVVERKKIVNGKTIRPGDVVIGIESSGIHSNGYSLVRKIVFDKGKLRIGDYVPDLQQPLAEALLTPTRIYTRPIVDLLQHYRVKLVVRGMAHITGGGIADNLERILPENIRVTISRRNWPVPPIFEWLQRLGNVDPAEMLRVFNMGIGFALVVNPYYAESIQRQLSQHRIKSWIIGEAQAGERAVEVVD